MSTKALALLVLAVLVGTALSVRWYLDAEVPAPEVREKVVATPARPHVPLPLRANPARSRQPRAALTPPKVAFEPEALRRTSAAGWPASDEPLAPPAGSSSFDAL